VQVVYNGSLFRPARIEHLSQDLLTIVAAAAADPDTKVKALALGGSDARHTGRKITINLGL
jgi:hypothetical protein